jgi:Kef-type K+ transport system membrane component KefB
VIEDIALWGIFAFAVSYATSVSIDGGATSTTALHIGLNIIYLTITLFVMPRVLSYLRTARWNFLYRTSPVLYIALIVIAYLLLANVTQTSIVFAAFLAGYGIVGGASGGNRRYFEKPFRFISKIGYGLFIPLYFALVGYRLVFDGTFSVALLCAFFFGSTILVIASMILAARLAGFRGISLFNIAVATNARGGPGIVLASAAYEAGIISAAFYTTLVLSALGTSLMAGWWLKYVVTKKLPLLEDEK